MKVTKKMVVLLGSILILTAIVYGFTYVSSGAAKNIAATSATAAAMHELPLPQANTKVDPTVLQVAPPMLSEKDMSPDNMIANFPDLDRAPLDDENLSLIPANEIIDSNYKDWYVGAVGANGVGTGAAVDKELYAKGKPLFNQTNVPLVPLDVNGTNRRVNFY
jgi:hypothetical protein